MCAILKWRRGARCDGFGSESLAIAERLAHSDPGNAGWQRDLSLSYAHLAYAYLKAEQPAEARADSNRYHVFRLTETPLTGPMSKLQPGKYLVDDQGALKYLVDPGINGVLKTRDDGTSVPKYEAPKARLMSLIIDGILTRKLPWGLVLLGVSIALVLELCGIASLPFAVGVYLPLSSSTPIFAGGMMRALIEYLSRKKGTKEAVDSESSPGILFSSGLIAGGSISGILLAILSVKEDLGSALDFSKYFPVIANSDLTSVIMFAVLCGCLLKVGRQKPAKMPHMTKAMNT